ncbi:hypothetical protein BGZ65_009650, partial [Modicella reniformis]
MPKQGRCDIDPATSQGTTASHATAADSQDETENLVDNNDDEDGVLIGAGTESEIAKTIVLL